MSTINYYPNGEGNDPVYKIGTVGWEGPKSIWYFEQYPDSVVPTYGLWAGPGYAAGERQAPGERVTWAEPPCYNYNIQNPDAVPEQCVSLMDAICKTHDWRYYQAEELEKIGNTAAAKQMVIDADQQLIFDVASALLSGSYNSPTGTYNEQNGTWSPQLYTNTFDVIEKGYAVDLIPLPTLTLASWRVVDIRGKYGE